MVTAADAMKFEVFKALIASIYGSTIVANRASRSQMTEISSHLR